MKKQFKILIVSLLLATLLFSQSILASGLYSIVTDQEVSNPVDFGLQQLESVIFKKKYQIERTIMLEESAGDIILIAGISSSPGTAARLLKELDNKLPDKPESFIIHRYQREGKTLIVMCGADQNGLMYAIMEVAERLGWSDNPNDLLQYVKNVYSEPEVPDRSVSMYTMQRAWFEQRLYDEDYWVRYFEMLAKSRINRFVMIFGYENGGFLAPPYPYFFDVEEYPDIRMGGITKTEQKKNTVAINRIIELAHDRGIKFVPGIWDHIYRGGVQSGGVKGKEETPGIPEHGLVWGLHADNLAGYTKAALRKFLKVFPDIDGIHFRMHGESGLKRNEIPVFWHEVFQLIKEERPSIQVEIRAKGLPDEVIEDAINQSLNFRVSTKYWMEQMGLPFHPTHINKQNQHDRRHGYADLLKYPQKYRVHWRLWNGGTARILLWGDPEYVRRFVASTKLYNGNSFEVNEPLATKMEAQSHDLKPFELINPGYRYYEYEFERYWYFFQLFGRIGYDPDIAGEVWINQFTSRFGEEAGVHLMKGLHLGSRILPIIIAAAYRYRYFPTTRGWPEKMRMDDLPLFATAEGSDIQQFLNFMEEADLILEGTETLKRRPFETSSWFREISDSILRKVTNAEKSIKDMSDKEFISTVTDLKILAYLSRYYSLRIPAAVYYNLFLKTGDLYSLENAIMQEENAIQAWSKLVRSAGKVYNDNLMMGICHGNMCGNWRDELKMLEEGIKSLKHNRDSIISIMHLSDISIAHVPVRKVRPGEMLSINATITGEFREIAVRCAVKLNAGEYTWYEMKPVDCFRYQLELPTPSNEGELFYYIEVTKNNDKLLTFPDQALEDHIMTLITDDFQPPDVIIHPVSEVKPGTDLEVLVEANDISGLKWVRLRYRHVTQFEDYLTSEMEYDPVRKAYKAQIPGDFIVPEWDLMFFVEVLDNKGNGRMYPDFEKDQPYVIVEPVRNN